MTNELTLAIERIERFADAKEAQGREHPVQVEREYHQELAAALRLVIEAARESLEEATDDAAVLSFDEALRIVTRDMHWFRREAHGNINPALLKRKQAAYKMVIEAAKRPTALSGEERRELDYLLEREYNARSLAPKGYGHKHQPAINALRAALSLASPFTEEEWAEIKELVDSAVAGMVRGVAQMGGPEKAYPLARLLRSIEAKLDAMLAQSGQNQ